MGVGTEATAVSRRVSALPSFRHLQTYPSELIAGPQYQEKFSLEIVADEQNRLYYGVKCAESPGAFCHYLLAGGISSSQLQHSHLEKLLAEIINHYFGAQVELSLARDMNYSLYQKLEQDLLLRVRQ